MAAAFSRSSSSASAASLAASASSSSAVGPPFPFASFLGASLAAAGGGAPFLPPFGSAAPLSFEAAFLAASLSASFLLTATRPGTFFSWS